MKNKTDLDLILSDFVTFAAMVIKDFGPAQRPPKAEIEKLKLQIINNPSNNDPHIQKNFFVIQGMDGSIQFSHNTEKYLGLSPGFDLKALYAKVDDGTGDWNYLKDYLLWAKSAYSFAKKNFKYIDTDKFAFKIRIPMQCCDGRYYWILKEVRPLEYDSENNILSHINIYTVSNLFKEKEAMGLVGEFYFDDTYHDEWNRTISESRFLIKPFILSPTQIQILNFFNENRHATIKDCALHIHYPANTIKKYISDSQRKNGIIDMAKASFPSLLISNLKDVVIFLDKIGWFL